MVVALVIALSLRGKIKRNESSGNEFFPWEREEKMKDPDEFEGMEPEDDEDYEEDDYEDEDDEGDEDEEYDEDDSEYEEDEN